MKIAIIGSGRFGTLLQKHLSTDNNVIMVDKSATVSLSDCALIIFAVPNRVLRQAIQQWKSKLAPSAIVMDVGSVKTIPCQILAEEFPEEFSGEFADREILGTHPLFGPDSASESWQGHKMVFCRLRCSDTTYAQVQELFTSRGVIPLECTPQQHDQMMAQTQALVHFIGRALTGLEPQDIATPDYANLLRMMEKVTHDTWELFFDMQTLNPYAASIRKNFIEKMNQLEQDIDAPKAAPNTVSALRSQIDVIDEQIVALIGQRFALAQQIGEVKKAQAITVQDPQRETQLYLRMHELSQRHAVPLEVVIHIYDYLLAESRKLQTPNP